jgi:superfamily II DNA or RNA helicase
MTKLRDYQIHDFNRIAEAYEPGHTRICFQSPTGSGKPSCSPK